MLTARQAEIVAEDSTTSVNIARGCSQDGILPPLFSSLVVDGLSHMLNDLGITFVGYADDAGLVPHDKFEKSLCELSSLLV